MVKKMDQLFYALSAILQPTIALLFQVQFILRGSIKRLKTLKLQDYTDTETETETERDRQRQRDRPKHQQTD